MRLVLLLPRTTICRDVISCSTNQIFAAQSGPTFEIRFTDCQFETKMQANRNICISTQNYRKSQLKWNTCYILFNLISDLFRVKCFSLMKRKDWRRRLSVSPSFSRPSTSVGAANRVAHAALSPCDFLHQNAPKTFG